jgi:hypothetical protein
LRRNVQTYEKILNAHDVEIPAHLVADAEVPVLSGPQRQGDVIVLPLSRPGAGKFTEIPAAGIAVVRGESGGNTHLLVGDGVWRENESASFDCGILTVPDGGAAFLLHPEHGAQGFAPGSYVIRRQREQAHEIRRVAD